MACGGFDGRAPDLVSESLETLLGALEVAGGEATRDLPEIVLDDTPLYVTRSIRAIGRMTHRCVQIHHRWISGG